MSGEAEESLLRRPAAPLDQIPDLRELHFAVVEEFDQLGLLEPCEAKRAKGVEVPRVELFLGVSVRFQDATSSKE